jgi:hypothetical protein
VITMKKLLLVAITASILATLGTGCGYAGVGTSGDKAVVARNDGFLFGILRKVFVCKVTDGGATACAEGTSP